MEEQRYKSEMLQETKEQTRLIEKIYNNVLFFFWLAISSIAVSVIAIVLSKPANIDETTSGEVEAPIVFNEPEVTAVPTAVDEPRATEARAEDRMGADVQAKTDYPATEAKAASKPAVDAGVSASSPTAVPSSLNEKSLEEDPSLE
jgi:hypothetical protein